MIYFLIGIGIIEVGIFIFLAINFILHCLYLPKKNYKEHWREKCE